MNESSKGEEEGGETTNSWLIKGITFAKMCPRSVRYDLQRFEFLEMQIRANNKRMGMIRRRET